MRYIFIFSLLGILLLHAAAWAQVADSSLVRARLSQLQKIERTNLILQQTEEKAAENMAALRALDEQIAQRNALLLALTDELQWLDAQIDETSTVVASMTEDLEKLKTEYAAMVYFSSKSGDAVERLSYLFSSETVNQFLARIQYLRQYQQSRQQQIQAINSVKGVLTEQHAHYETLKESKTALLDSTERNGQTLYALKEERKAMIDKLKAKDKTLREALRNEQAALQTLDQRINERVKQRVSLSESGDADLPPTPSTTKSAADFSALKGYLGWPVEEGFISSQFGKHPHPVLTDIWIENNGVDIRTKAGAQVRAVYGGRVVLVTKLPEMEYMVLVQHGNYFTAYSKLESVTVGLNDVVDKNQPLGKVLTNAEGVAEVQFQIWHYQQKLNPSFWLSK